MHPWLKEFYPFPADAMDNDRSALEHSIQKWTGLLPENLKKHNVKIRYGSVIDAKGFIILSVDGSTCALCIQYYKGPGNCSNCPLRELLGHSCDGHENQLYPSFFYDALSKPSIMIDALQECLQDDFTL